MAPLCMLSHFFKIGNDYLYIRFSELYFVNFSYNTVKLRNNDDATSSSNVKYILTLQKDHIASQVAQVVKNLPANAGDMRYGFDPWVWKIPWKRKWQPTPVFLPEEFHVQRSLAGCSLWDHKRVGHSLATK